MNFANVYIGLQWTSGFCVGGEYVEGIEMAMSGVFLHFGIFQLTFTWDTESGK